METHHNLDVTKVLYLIENLSKDEKIHLIGTLLALYTTDQREAIVKGKIRNSMLLEQVEAGWLTPVHIYAKNTKRPHSIYYTEDIVKYLEKIKKLRIAREEYYK